MWTPLVNLIGSNRCGDFMYMGQSSWGNLHMYKNRNTRRYINIDASTGLTYKFDGSSPQNGYDEVPADKAIEWAFS